MTDLRDIKEENINEARLIAAAPQMYNILKAIQNWWKEGCTPIHCDSLIFGEFSISDEIDGVLDSID